MKGALVDTDTISYFFRGIAEVTAKLHEYVIEQDHLYLSVVTYYEILNGLYFKNARNQLVQFEQFVSLNEVLPVTTKIAKSAAGIYAELRRQGQTIGHNDVLIAGTAIVNGLTLVTNNTRHFSKIPSLDIDNWVS